MKQYLIIKSFTGSQTGTDSQEFVEGSTVPVSDHLAAAIAGTGWIEPATGASGTQVALPAQGLETKILGPEESKPLDLSKLKSNELKALAKERGITFKFNTKNAELIAALQAA